MKKTILEKVHSTAAGLHKAELMDVKTMREFDALCLPPVKIYSASLKLLNIVDSKGLDALA